MTLHLKGREGGWEDEGREEKGWDGREREGREGEGKWYTHFLRESYALSITLNCKGLFTARKVN